MENHEEHLNEAKYQQANQKIKTVGVIVLLVGLAIIGLGIFNIVTANSTKTPDSSTLEATTPSIDSSNPFATISEQIQQQHQATSNRIEQKYNSKENRMSQQFVGIFLCMSGFLVSAIGCILRFYVPNKRDIAAYSAQQIKPIAQEDIEKMAPTFGVAAKEISKGIKEGLKDDKE